ncbi:hypothetical protein HPB50_004462 [Hyalomma asiaticum]|uniref:Uncharacterized protein n=1 Tax=Hyalomma asiaticum TaxID=266040 RepID=A0ACB7TCZ6_HYAAI|nr:hypothetical protein HPB50_004462 [Hyalomma asiaticum]
MVHELVERGSARNAVFVAVERLQQQCFPHFAAVASVVCRRLLVTSRSPIIRGIRALHGHTLCSGCGTWAASAWLGRRQLVCGSGALVALCARPRGGHRMPPPSEEPIECALSPALLGARYFTDSEDAEPRLRYRRMAARRCLFNES